MRGDLLDKSERSGEPGRFMLQNERMLKVDLSGRGGFLYARQGSMVAYQGEVDFSYEGSGADLLGRARRLLGATLASPARAGRFRARRPRHGHSLTAPSVEPEMMCLWKAKNISAIGIVMITAAASLSG